MHKIPVYKCGRCSEEHVGLQVSEEKISFVCDGFMFYKDILDSKIVWEKYKLERKT